MKKSLKFFNGLDDELIINEVRNHTPAAVKDKIAVAYIVHSLRFRNIWCTSRALKKRLELLGLKVIRTSIPSNEFENNSNGGFVLMVPDYLMASKPYYRNFVVPAQRFLKELAILIKQRR